MPKTPLNFYKGTFNYQREVHIIYQWAISREHAKWLMIKALAGILGKTRISISNYFCAGKDNFSIERTVYHGKEKERTDCDPSVSNL